VTDSQVAEKKVTVIGAARSGLAAARLMQEMGAMVFVSESGVPEKLAAQISDLKAAGIEYETGGHTERALDAEIMIVSPGVPSDAPVIRKALDRGLRVVSELEAASWFCPSPVIAVTGTNGKTTTTTLIGKVMHDAGRKHVVGGNIGTAFSSLVGTLDAGSVAILEVSSFQLDYIESFHPKVSIILNITPDHLDRYGHNFAKYIASKCRIFENQTSEDFLIYNYDDPETREQVRRYASLHVHAVPFALERKFEEGAFVENKNLITVIGNKKSDVIETGRIGIRGIHNLYNSMAAALAGAVMKVSGESLRSTLASFKGVEHRLEFVREFEGVKYINDSKATNVDSVWYALQSYREPLIVLVGGRDKGNDYSRLHALVKKNVKAVVAIGESAEKVYQEFCSMTIAVKAAGMEEAVKLARELARAGDIVMLSPACASFDWFENYEQRGRVFKQIVNSL